VGGRKGGARHQGTNRLSWIRFEQVQVKNNLAGIFEEIHSNRNMFHLERAVVLSKTVCRPHSAFWRRGYRQSSAVQQGETEQIAKFFTEHKQFAVVGASSDRNKFGNKVLLCYLNRTKTAIPINPKEKEIEHLSVVDSLSTLAKQKPSAVPETGVSIITPPAVTRAVLEEGISKGYRSFFLQPGTTDESVKTFLKDAMEKDTSIKVIHDCVLVQLGCEG
jgi:predicted CoA-binding protein